MNKGFISVVSVLAGAVAGVGTVGKIAGDSISRAQKMSDKHLALFLMMNHWVKVKQEGKNLSSYFKQHDYKKIAIYGMSYAGETLIDELRGTGVEIVCGIDNNAASMYSDVKILEVNDFEGNVDVVVVTAITFFDEIEDQLSKRLDCPIISLEDVLYDV
ncbi:MAG: hypothetical protein K2H37_03165 [Lachnospiraceae bacterium]|nr:hypothetical protein [Lachnospiraceae bacterium]